LTIIKKFDKINIVKNVPFLKRWGRVHLQNFILKNKKYLRKGEKIMKRSKIIMAFLLCACLIVGVGYAAVVDVMDITGTAEFNMDDSMDSNVYFSEAYAIPDKVSGKTENTASVTTVRLMVPNWKGSMVFSLLITLLPSDSLEAKSEPLPSLRTILP
jgi:hypothetical protein